MLGGTSPQCVRDVFGERISMAQTRAVLAEEIVEVVLFVLERAQQIANEPVPHFSRGDRGCDVCRSVRPTRRHRAAWSVRCGADSPRLLAAR